MKKYLEGDIVIFTSNRNTVPLRIKKSVMGAIIGTTVCEDIECTGIEFAENIHSVKIKGNPYNVKDDFVIEYLNEPKYLIHPFTKN